MTRQTQAPEAQSLAHEVIDAMINFPMFLFEYTIGLIVMIISDVYIATLALAGGAVGLASNDWKIGLATFFVVYSFSRVVNTVANAVGTTGQNIGMAVNNGLVQHGHAVRLAANSTDSNGNASS